MFHQSKTQTFHLFSCTVASKKRLANSSRHLVTNPLCVAMIKSFCKLSRYGLRVRKVSILQLVRRTSIVKICADAKVTRSHCIYKINYRDDKTLSLKAHIPPHENEYSQKDQLQTERRVRLFFGVRTVLSVASMYNSRLTRADSSSSYVQTGKAQRDVYVLPTHKSSDRAHYWLLLAAAYGMVNANAK